MNQPRFLSDQEFKAILLRTLHDAEVRRDLLGYLHHAEAVLRLDRRAKNPNVHATQVVLADNYLSEFRQKCDLGPRK